MGVDSHSYGWFAGGMDGGGVCCACGMKPGDVGRMTGDAGELPECDMKTLITPDHMAFQVRLSG